MHNFHHAILNPVSGQNVCNGVYRGQSYNTTKPKMVAGILTFLAYRSLDSWLRIHEQNHFNKLWVYRRNVTLLLRCSEVVGISRAKPLARIHARILK